MSKKKKRKSASRKELKRTVKYEIAALLLLAVTLVAALDLGVIGKAVIFVFRFFFGEWYVLLLLAMILLSFQFMWKREWPYLLSRRLLGIYIITCSLLLLSHVTLFELLVTQNSIQHPSVISNTWELFWMDVDGETSTHDLGGGMVGAFVFAFSFFLVDSLGTKILAVVLIMIGLALLTGKTFGDLFGKGIERASAFFKKQWSMFKKDMSTYKVKRKEKKQHKQEERENQTEDEEEVEVVQLQPEPREEPIISNFAEVAYRNSDQPKEKKSSKDEEATDTSSDIVPAIQFSEVENKDYQLPPLRLLHAPKQSDQSGEYELIHANAAKLERTFQSFGVKAKVTQVHIGPAVTKYEVYPDIGVKVSKIVNLSDDLALALAAKDIRIEAPIPGKSAIGIEVPNSEVAMVSLREVLDATATEKPESKLLIGLGRDITGEAVFAELNKMPHLLVAGATGSGKSVCVNGIITSILMRAKPHEVKLMMIDPKMVELNVYNGIPHLLAPVVTDAKKASQALKKVVSEMERRYELFSHTGTRNIEGYNELVRKQNAENEEKQPLLPFIVVIVDELADLMMVASNDVEDSITRLAQMARAAGIHLIIATQRPSVDVITGVIKANIPSRIAFAVSSQTDSRTILDMGGAEKLLGRGDMLFLPVGAAKPTRIQGAFMSDEEVEEIVEYVVAQQKAQYNEDMIPEEVVENREEVDDELYEDAVDLVVDMQSASVSMLQRRFRIGYTRAARLIDEMELRGIVGPYEGSKPRTVLVTKSSDEATPS
ncbi:DNA translocase SpoIIIE [Bacillus carboniphilus]|uniref:DNA translocase SpoIIIE n=1 Tax=Bacillus carboniphilus TaxID=86663 RepID=A0ABP3G1U2_9BACI